MIDTDIEIKHFYNGDKDKTDLKIKDSPEDFIVQEITSEEEICIVKPIINLVNYLNSVKLLCFLFTEKKSEDEILDFVINLGKEKIFNQKEVKNELIKLKSVYNALKYTSLTLENKELRTRIHKLLNYNLLLNTKTLENKFIIKRSDYNTYNFILKKVMMNTVDACKIIERNIGSSVSFAGNKDKKAVTYQEVSIKSNFINLLNFACEYTECTKEDYDNIKLFKNIENITITEEENYIYNEESIKKFKSEKKEYFQSLIGIYNIRRGHPKKLGALSGNKFTIRIKNQSDLKYKNIEKGFINYYGAQRFGKAKNNHFIGEKILNKEYEEAINLIIKNSNGYEDYIKGRIDDCLKKCDNIERYIFKILIKSADNGFGRQKCVMKDNQSRELNIKIDDDINKSVYKKIIFGMRREIRMIYLHSYQSYLFNKQVNDFLGYNQEILSLESPFNLTLDLQKMNDKLLKGGVRNIFCKGKNVKGWQDGVDFVISFELKASCYATMALREI